MNTDNKIFKNLTEHYKLSSAAALNIIELVNLYDAYDKEAPKALK